MWIKQWESFYLKFKVLKMCENLKTVQKLINSEPKQSTLEF
jgi:hypothetical protein